MRSEVGEQRFVRLNFRSRRIGMKSTAAAVTTELDGTVDAQTPSRFFLLLELIVSVEELDPFAWGEKRGVSVEC